ncbi:MAG: four helix bundle protein [Parcubacteria group bacterium]|jgi:four helix bundle protein
MYKFERLDVYKKALVFNGEIFKISEKFPPHLKFSLISQIIRAAISVIANIAEASGRISNKESRNLFNIAKGSLYEVVSLLDLALMQGYISKEDYNKLYKQSEEIAKMLSGLIKYNEK